jgi:diacylglycerol kinase (ATP)
MRTTLKYELDKRLRSFHYAFEGWWYVLRTQRNAWIHTVITLAVLALAFWLRLSRQDWAILLLIITAVWMAEFMNTALETIVNLVSPDFHPLAKIAKDVGSAAVLVGALGAVLIGLLILGPPLWAKLTAGN